jgi:LuxR family transcriptional regulator, maltose regulon positive regulatory protein
MTATIVQQSRRSGAEVGPGARSKGDGLNAKTDNRTENRLGHVLIETKLRAPAVRDQDVLRERLIGRLQRGSQHRLTLLACPAGFGKTTLLAAWREVEAARKPVAWLTLDDGDNDVVVLWSYVIEALHRVCPAMGQFPPPRTVRAASLVDAVLPRLVNELDGLGEVALVLDDFHRLGAGAARDSIAWLVDHAPPRFQLVLSTRTEPTFPLAALRAHGELVELRSDDLRFTTAEADTFMNGRLGLELAAGEVGSLVERTGGWPAGLYLAALSLEGAADHHSFVNELGTSNRHVLDFLKKEVLEAHDPAMQTLMLRSSVLGQLSGPLCDALLEREGSGPMLEALSRSNLFLEPLNGGGSWYRFHQLFGRILQVELERREPGLAPVLHRRACAWYRDHGSTDEAISHAIEAGAYPEAAEIIESSWVNYANLCRCDTVLAWIRRLPAEMLSGDVRLLLVKAWALSLSARREEAAAVVAAIEKLGELDGEQPLPDGFSSAAASLTVLKACCPWGDVGAQLASARRAAELEGPSSPLRPIACWAVGVGLYFGGNLDEADRWFAESQALAPAREQWVTGASSKAYRSLIAGEQERFEEQHLLAERAAGLVAEHGVEEASGVVPLALGVSFERRGRPREALTLIERSVSLLLRSPGQPTEVAMALLHEASVLRSLGERERALAAINQARSIIGSCPDAGMLTGRLTESGRSALQNDLSGDQHLTKRELWVLQLLSSDLSERAIAEELYLSHHTVHSHVTSIYRKLGVSTRSGAVARASELVLG